MGWISDKEKRKNIIDSIEKLLKTVGAGDILKSKLWISDKNDYIENGRSDGIVYYINKILPMWL